MLRVRGVVHVLRCCAREGLVGPAAFGVGGGVGNDGVGGLWLEGGVGRGGAGGVGLGVEGGAGLVAFFVAGFDLGFC